jgi:hypothetical protein
MAEKALKLIYMEFDQLDSFFIDPPKKRTWAQGAMALEMKE